MLTLCLEVILNSVTCPGVWLCPKGQIMVKVSTLGISRKTRRIYPKFPLQFKETFHFQRLIVGSIRSVAEILETEQLTIELIQWMGLYSKLGIVLAKFNQNLADIFQPLIVCEQVPTTIKVDLLTSRTHYFPGIISPKLHVKISFKIISSKNKTNNWMNSPLQISGKYLCRQRSVCHSNSRHPCHNYYDCIPNEKCSMCISPQSTVKNSSYKKSESDQCYQDEKKNLFCSWCNCTVLSCQCFSCWKYHSIFH